MEKTEGMGAIRPDELYPLQLFERLVGLGRSSIREARRRGLQIDYVHGRGFVRGAAWMEYVEKASQPMTG